MSSHEQQHVLVVAVACLSSIIAVVPMATAQEVIYSWSESSTGCFGARGLRSMPDLDGDGFRELLLGSPNMDPLGVRDAGAVCVVSGRTASTIFSAFGPREDFNLGITIAPLDDTNGDGIPDYAASAYRGGRSYVYSGADGKVLFEHPFRADTIVSLGDIDHDGFSDLLLSVIFTSFPTRVWIYRGGSFDAKFLLQPPPGPVGQLSNFGVDSAPLGDVDGDGIGDFVIGEDFPTRKDQIPGRAHVYSGATGQLLYSIERGAHFGLSVEALGDLNGNGVCDFAAGTESGVIEFFEGSNGGSLGIVEDPEGYRLLGRYFLFAGDVNGNGCNDLLCHIEKLQGPGQPPLNKVWVLDGSTHELLLETDYYFGFSEGGNDWNSDDSPEYLRRRDQNIELVSLAPPWAKAMGTPCSTARGESPRILANGQPSAGGQVNVALTGVTAGRSAFLLLNSFSAARFPWLRGGRSCSSLFLPHTIMVTSTVEAGCGAAGASLWFPIPDDSSLSGQRFLTQWLISSDGLASSSLSATRALEIEIE